MPLMMILQPADRFRSAAAIPGLPTTPPGVLRPCPGHERGAHSSGLFERYRDGLPNLVANCSIPASQSYRRLIASEGIGEARAQTEGELAFARIALDNRELSHAATHLASAKPVTVIAGLL